MTCELHQFLNVQNMFIHQAQNILYTTETKPAKTIFLQIRTFLLGKKRYTDRQIEPSMLLFSR